MARLLKAMPELVTMIKGMYIASRAVGSSLLLLAGLIYVFAIMMFLFLKDFEPVDHQFSTLGYTMWTLLMDGVFLVDAGGFLRTLLDQGYWTMVFVFLTFLLVSTMTVMNMLIGVLCEVVSGVAAIEKEEAAINFVKENLLKMLKRLDEDESGALSREEIDHVTNDPDALDVLFEIQVDVDYFMHLHDMIFEDPEKEMSIEEIMELILTCRGDRPATMQDIVDGHTYTLWAIGNALNELELSMQRHMDVWARGIANGAQTGKTVSSC